MEFTNEKQPNSLMKEEKVLKDWNYAVTKGSVTASHNLTITDKRIIVTDSTSYKNGSTVSKQEIKNKDITGLSVSTSNQNFIMNAILSLVFAVLVAILALAVAKMPVLLIFSAVFLILAVYFFLKGKSSLTLTIYTKNINTEAMGLFANAGLILKRKNKSLKVKVNKEVAEDIVNNIGYYLLID